MSFNDNSILYTPHYVQIERRGLYLLIDPEAPNWIATDGRGAWILQKVRAGRTFKELISEYAADYGMEATKAWLHVDCFLKDARRHRFADYKPFSGSTYTGRRDYLPDTLDELWLHTNNSCNLTCAHCLVNSSPRGDAGLPGDRIREIIDQADELGVGRFYFTGGEPMVRRDFFELAEYVTEGKGKELIVLTNGTLLRSERLERFKDLDAGKLKLQISLDGSSPRINDPIRGEGSFWRIVEGIENAVSIGFMPTVTTAVSAQNLDDLGAIAELLSQLGVENHHFLWMHRRGRARESGDGFFPSNGNLIAAVTRAKKRADELGITIDNFEYLKARLDSRRGTKFDLGNAGLDSLCVYYDGGVYPSAALAGCSALRCGSILEEPLEKIWRDSPVCRELRSATVQRKALCQDCHLRFLCGGGDIEHSYLYSRQVSKDGGTFLGPDPYCGLHRAMIEEALFELAEEGERAFNRRSGFDAPLVYRAMGEGVAPCAEGSPVQTVHSACVLSFHLDKRRMVREFYAQAADEPKENLCCPTGYSPEDASHIPQEVLARAYGCGSPIGLAGVRQGEVVLDLGSGAGIDCFIAANKAGPSGMVIGLDMTDRMLKIASESKALVAENLGYDAVSFLNGFMEAIPLRDKSVDLITSNCVINLSPDKKRVFREMWRVLKDYGRIVVSDIVSQGEIPAHLRGNERLWGECMGGALTEEEFHSFLEQAGFHGLQTLSKTYWREVEGYRFFAVTVRGYKFEKREGCAFVGQMAVYHGPFKAVMDEEGHLFPRNEAVEVCTDTGEKLRRLPYKGFFTLIEPAQGRSEEYSYCGDECCSD